MPTFSFSKLVRDHIVEQQIASGAKPTYRKLDPDAHKHQLIKKIIEEASEISEATADEIADEIADVQQALDDLRELHGLSAKDITTAQQIKRDKRGAFRKGLFVDRVTLDEDDQWVAYYRAHADRYPEISAN